MEEKKTLEPEILDGIKPFSGLPDEMSAGEKMLIEGKSLQKIQTTYTTAIAVQKPRSIARVAHNVLEEAKLAGASFYYGWTAKTKNGPVRIEGPSIDLAMCLARHYGNCAIDIEGTETPTHFMLKGIFIDLESGFTCPRLFRQRKTQSLGGKMEKDADRQEDIVFQIGQSKAIRNAIIRAMPAWLIEQAIEMAKQAELGKIKPENIHLARTRVLNFFAPYGITPERIEAKMGRKVDDWTAQDIVDLRGMATALKEGRVSAEELFPPIPMEENQEQPKEEPVKDTKQQDEAKPQPQEPSKDAEIDPFRKEYINLRSSGFSTWAYKNLERIKQADPEHQEEIRAKWEKLYKDVKFPLDPEPNGETNEEPVEQEETPQQNGNNSGAATVFCPVKQSRVFLSVCETKCDKKENCVAYREAVMLLEAEEVEKEENQGV